MTEPSQYFKGRTVQEQMNEVIGYVDARAEEVAAAKADDVLEPAEQAKDDAIAAKEAAEQARDTTLAALPAVNERIDDVELDLNAVTLRVTTAEGDIVTIQGRITAVETKNSQQDSAIAALQTADAQNVKLTGTHAIGNYAVLLTGNQEKSGILSMLSRTDYPNRNIDIFNPPGFSGRGISEVKSGPDDENTVMREDLSFSTSGNTLQFTLHCGDEDGVTDHTATLMFTVFRDGKARLQLQRESGTVQIVPQG